MVAVMLSYMMVWNFESYDGLEFLIPPSQKRLTFPIQSLPKNGADISKRIVRHAVRGRGAPAGARTSTPIRRPAQPGRPARGRLTHIPCSRGR
jgi:hypothetical protein